MFSMSFYCACVICY